MKMVELLECTHENSNIHLIAHVIQKIIVVR